jgi:hypothetical protein
MPYIDEKCPICGGFLYATFLDVGHATKYCPCCDNPEYCPHKVRK